MKGKVSDANQICHETDDNTHLHTYRFLEYECLAIPSDGPWLLPFREDPTTYPRGQPGTLKSQAMWVLFIFLVQIRIKNYPEAGILDIVSVLLFYLTFLGSHLYWVVKCHILLKTKKWIYQLSRYRNRCLFYDLWWKS